MTTLSFTKNVRGWNEATVNGFTGILQVDRASTGNILIYGKTTGAEDCLIYAEVSKSSLVNVDVPSSVTLRVECETNVTLAQYDAD